MIGARTRRSIEKFFQRREAASPRWLARMAVVELVRAAHHRLVRMPVARDLAIELTVTASEAPPSLTLHVPGAPRVTSTRVHRRRKGETSWASWGEPIAQLVAGQTTWTDTAIEVGQAYEYGVLRRHARAPWRSTGRIFAGVRVEAPERRGAVVLVIDETHAAALATEIDRLARDLTGDGHHVERVLVKRDERPEGVKAKIRAAYDADPDDVRHVFLLGHVPVPYAGNLAPDGHSVPRPGSPVHRGAWPADGYYGDMHGVWTDETVDTRSNTHPPARPENENVPGDGKFDQDELPLGKVDLAVGRVDLAHLPAFAKGEVELLRQYLDKDHAFRHGRLTAGARGLVDDNFGYVVAPKHRLRHIGKAYSAGAYRAFAAFFGGQSIVEDDFFGTLEREPFLFAYACGPGQFDRCNGVGQTRDFALRDPKAIFTMLLGSYFGDWDSVDCFLRAPLATSHGLVSAWCGIPDWSMHAMAIGEPAGYCAKLTQETEGLDEDTGTRRRPGASVHVALMGDPTLRMHPLGPVTGGVATRTEAGVTLDWRPSIAGATGYRVDRAASPGARFERVSEAVVVGTTWTDPRPPAGACTYLIRAVVPTTTPSGSYLNLSQGAFVDCP